MKKTITFLLLKLLISGVAIAEKSVVIEGMKYTLIGNKSVRLKAVKKKDLVNIEIPSSVKIGDFDYFVTEIEELGFEGCKNLKQLVLPNSIDLIGTYAFKDCIGLESIIVPDEAESKIATGHYGYGRDGIFKGCTSLTQVRGHDVMYPQYILYDALYNCEEVPFYKTVQEMGAANMVAMKMNRKFKDFATEKVKKPVEEWQRRKEYETRVQWESRVTDVNRKRMIDEAIGEARQEYVKTFAPAHLKGVLGEYNTEYGFFPVEVGALGTIYATVPFEEAEKFKSHWKEVEIHPVYGVVDEEIGILSASFSLNGREYRSYTSIAEDDLSDLALNITPLTALKEYEQMLASGEVKVENLKYFDPDAIDIDIPLSGSAASNTFAVIIGNENYQRVAPVDFAMNDARIFAKYCNRTLGIPEQNIRTYYNSTYGDIVAAMEDIRNISEAYKGSIDVIFYYAGHGLPDEGNRNAYLLPIDATGTQIDACYPMSRLYGELSDLNANSVTAFIDACFSGSLRGEGMLASARGIKLKPRDVSVKGNMVVLSASSADQSAFPYPEKGHGLFSYYLLKKLNETKGDVTMGELADYVTSEVSKQSIVENKKPQIPEIKWSENMADNWRGIKLRK